MEFLQICQAVMREGGISGQINSVENQQGEALRVVEWVKLAYREILNSDQFSLGFLRMTSTVQLTAGKAVYTKDELSLASLGQWDIHTMRVAVNADLSDETYLAGMRHPELRNYWDFSSRRQMLSRPLNCSVTPETNLEIRPIPDRDYYLNLQWVQSPPDLLDNEDVPIIPTRWVMSIVWRALRHYGMFESAPEVVLRADSNYKEIAMLMTLDQSPEIVVGGPIC